MIRLHFLPQGLFRSSWLLKLGILNISLISAGASGFSASSESQRLHRPDACGHDAHQANQSSSSSPLATDISEASPEIQITEFEGRRKLRNAQKSLHLVLETEISKLCDILQLSVCLSLPVNLKRPFSSCCCSVFKFSNIVN